MTSDRPRDATGPDLASWILVLSLPLTTACVTAPSVWKASLYPIAGPYAGSAEPISAEFLYSTEGHGQATFMYPDSVACKGEYNTVFSGGDSVQLRLWHDKSLASVVGTIGPHLAYGTATGTCQDGTLIECAYSVNRTGGHGTGSCRDSKDGEYKLHF